MRVWYAKACCNFEAERSFSYASVVSGEGGAWFCMWRKGGVLLNRGPTFGHFPVQSVKGVFRRPNLRRDCSAFSRSEGVIFYIKCGHVRNKNLQVVTFLWSCVSICYGFDWFNELTVWEREVPLQVSWLTVRSLRDDGCVCVCVGNSSCTEVAKVSLGIGTI